MADCTTPAMYNGFDGGLVYGLSDSQSGGPSCWLVIDGASRIPADGVSCGPDTYIDADGRYVLLSDYGSVVMVDTETGTSQILDFVGRATFVGFDF